MMYVGIAPPGCTGRTGPGPFYPIPRTAGSVAPLTLLAQLSDPHVFAATGDPAAADALAAAVRDVRALRPAPDAVLLSGDLAADGRPEEYARVRELVAPLAMAVHALPGNHDDRAALRAAFGLPGAGDEGSDRAGRSRGA
jgi:3',5'-cyclic AMP phosphodiesterase CpdA